MTTPNHTELTATEKARLEEIEWQKTELDCYQQSVVRYSTEASFYSFYLTSYEEYSQAEGGCYYFHREALACFPISQFKDEDEAKAFARDKFGVTFEGDTVTYSDGRTRKVAGFTSCRPEANCEVFLERFPFQELTTEIPHYE